MNEKSKETRARVYLRRAVLAALDAAIVAFSFYFALLLRADGAVEAAWWPHNLAILYRNLPWIVAVYVASFLLGGLYSVLWKYAGERGGLGHQRVQDQQAVWPPGAGRGR